MYKRPIPRDNFVAYFNMIKFDVFYARAIVLISNEAHRYNRSQRKSSGTCRKYYPAVHQARAIQKHSSLIIPSVLGKHSTKLKVIRCGSNCPNLANIKQGNCTRILRKFPRAMLTYISPL